ncbi:MAG: HlyD family efflux transporter periplasmic adaptor subunit [Gemmataceae bacterium]
MNDTTNNGSPAALETPSRTLSLSQKVQSLRLADKMAGGDGGASRGLVWFLVTLVVILGVGLAYNFATTQAALKKIDDLDKKSAAAAKKDEEDDGDATPASAEEAPRRDEIAIQYKGFITPISTILVSPLVGGRVVYLKFKEGQTVPKGALLAKIEDTEFKADFDKANGALDAARRRVDVLEKYRDDEIKQAKADFDETMALREQARLDYERSMSLRKTNSIAEKDLEDAEFKYKSLDARMLRLKLGYTLLIKGPRDEQIASAKADVAQAEAQHRYTKWRLDNCVVNAPIDGTILSKKAEEANQVNPAAFSNGLAASLCEMADLTDLEIDVSIVERDRAKVKVNQECRIRVDAWPGKVYEGYVSRIMPTADRSKNAIPVRVRISKKRLEQDRREGGPFLLPDMSAVVMFLNKDADPKVIEK